MSFGRVITSESRIAIRARTRLLASEHRSATLHAEVARLDDALLPCGQIARPGPGPARVRAASDPYAAAGFIGISSCYLLRRALLLAEGAA